MGVEQRENQIVTRETRTPKTPHPDIEGLRFRLEEALGKNEQKWLAEHSGVEASTITRIIKGQALVGVPGDTIVRLARALGVSPGWLLAGDGPKRAIWVQAEVQPQTQAPVRKKRSRSSDDSD